MILNLQGEINTDMVKDLIEFCNQGYDDNEIYLNSHGGNLADMVVMLDIINKRSRSTTLIGYEQLSSAAFVLFYSVNCKIEIINDCFGMFHKAYSAFNLHSDGNVKKDFDKFQLSIMSNMQESLDLLIKRLKFNKTEIAKYKDGKDVYFAQNRMLEFAEIRNKENKYI